MLSIVWSPFLIECAYASTGKKCPAQKLKCEDVKEKTFFWDKRSTTREKALS
jgi:hypothetical protein